MELALNFCREKKFPLESCMINAGHLKINGRRIALCVVTHFPEKRCPNGKDYVYKPSVFDSADYTNELLGFWCNDWCDKLPYDKWVACKVV